MFVPLHWFVAEYLQTTQDPAEASAVFAPQQQLDQFALEDLRALGPCVPWLVDIRRKFLPLLRSRHSFLPFYNWPLLSYKIQHDCKIFNRTVYENIFQEYFPGLAKIPHSRDLPRWRGQPPPTAKCTKPWSRNLLQAMCDKDHLTLIDKVKCMPRLLMGTIVGKRYETMIHNVQRLYLLEDRAKSSGIRFDWEEI